VKEKQKIAGGYYRRQKGISLISGRTKTMPSEKATYRQRDILLTRFPFSGLVASGSSE
jgi:hypothetical protein